MTKGVYYGGGRPRLEPDRPEAKATTMGVALSATQLERLEQLRGDGRSRAAVIREALDEFLDRYYPLEDDTVA